MITHLEKVQVIKYVRGGIYNTEKELIRTCECTLLIDGRQHCTIRVIPRDLELLGQGYSILLSYKPEQVFIFKAEEDELIVNTLTCGKYEHVYKRGDKVNISPELVINLAREVEYYKIDNMVDVSLIYSLDKRRIIGIIVERCIDSMTYKIIGLVYRMKNMLDRLVIVTTMNIDSSFINYISILDVKYIITTGTVTYDAVVVAQKYSQTLIGDVDVKEESYTVYTS